MEGRDRAPAQGPDPRDPGDPRDKRVPGLCPKVWFRVRETILFTLRPVPDRPRPPGRPWVVPGPSPGGVFKTKILFLRRIKAPAGALNTKTEFWGKIKAPAGALNTQTEFLRKIKAPAGTYKACRCLILYNRLSCLYIKDRLLL